MKQSHAIQLLGNMIFAMQRVRSLSAEKGGSDNIELDISIGLKNKYLYGQYGEAALEKLAFVVSRGTLTVLEFTNFMVYATACDLNLLNATLSTREELPDYHNLPLTNTWDDEGLDMATHSFSATATRGKDTGAGDPTFYTIDPNGNGEPHPFGWGSPKLDPRNFPDGTKFDFRWQGRPSGGFMLRLIGVTK